MRSLLIFFSCSSLRNLFMTERKLIKTSVHFRFFVAILIAWMIGLPQSAYTQPFTPPVQITTGNDDDIHPALTDAPDWWFQPEEEWLAFSRNGKNILAMKTTDLGSTWPDTLYTFTTDSMDNDFPSLTRAHFIPFQSYGLMLVWQSRKFGNLDIFYSLRRDSVWSIPRNLTTDPADDRAPHVTYRDSGFAVVWEGEGRILFAEYLNDQWSMPEFVTPPGDTLNSLPNVHYVGLLAQAPMVVWERSKSPDAGSAIMFSVKHSIGWTIPDTVQFVEDNRKPRFFKVLPQYANVVIIWNSTTQGGTSLVMREGYYSNNVLTWSPVSAPPQLPGINRDAAFNGTLIISKHNAPGQLSFSVGVWTNSSPAGRGQISVLLPFALEPVNITDTMPGFNRNPDVAAGIFRDGAEHIWVAWENNRDSAWKIFGSYVSYGFLDVDEQQNHPAGTFALDQNYPNPFNPTTKIKYQIPNSNHVTLKVFDILGRGVRTLVNETQVAGVHEVTFDTAGLTSGVYFYRLTAGSSVQTRKLVLVK